MSEQEEIATWLDANRAMIAHQEHLDVLAGLRYDNGVMAGTVFYYCDYTGTVVQTHVHCGPYAFLPSSWEAAYHGLTEAKVHLYDC